MRLVHESAAGTRTLATDVETADSLVAQLKGLMGRSSVPEDYALVFPVRRDPVAVAIDRLPGPLGRLADPDRHGVHMLFVRTPLDVVWVDDGDVVQVRTLQPWTGRASARADMLVELAPGGAAGVEPGDTVRLVADDEPADPAGRSDPPRTVGDGETGGQDGSHETGGPAADGGDPTV
ncbi:MAG: DUF192 domain-containing protein [Haloarculaceae archaeon]